MSRVRQIILIGGLGIVAVLGAAMPFVLSQASLTRGAFGPGLLAGLFDPAGQPGAEGVAEAGFEPVLRSVVAAEDGTAQAGGEEATPADTVEKLRRRLEAVARERDEASAALAEARRRIRALEDELGAALGDPDLALDAVGRPAVDETADPARRAAALRLEHELLRRERDAARNELDRLVAENRDLKEALAEARFAAESGPDQPAADRAVENAGGVEADERPYDLRADPITIRELEEQLEVAWDEVMHMEAALHEEAEAHTAELDAVHAELEQARARVDTLEAQLAEETAAAKEAGEALAAAEQVRDDAETELQKAAERIAALEEETAALAEARDAAVARREDVAAELVEARRRIAALEESRAEAAEASGDGADAAGLRDRVAALEEERDAALAAGRNALEAAEASFAAERRRFETRIEQLTLALEEAGRDVAPAAGATPIPEAATDGAESGSLVGLERALEAARARISALESRIAERAPPPPTPAPR